MTFIRYAHFRDSFKDLRGGCVHVRFCRDFMCDMDEVNAISCDFMCDSMSDVRRFPSAADTLSHIKSLLFFRIQMVPKLQF
jgi:hypothetical protein